MAKITAALIKSLRECTGAGILECKMALIKSNGNIELAISNMRKSGQLKAANKIHRLTSEGIILAGVSSNSKFGVLLELNCETDFVSRETNFTEFGNKILKNIMINKSSNIDELRAEFEERRAEIVVKLGENINIRRLKILEGKNIVSYLHGSRIGVIVSFEGLDNKFARYIAMHIAACNPKYITPESVPYNIIACEQQIQFNIAKQSSKSHNITEKIVIGRVNKFISSISLVNQQFVMDLSRTVGSLLKEKNIKVIDFVRFEIGEDIKN